MFVLRHLTNEQKSEGWNMIPYIDKGLKVGTSNSALDIFHHSTIFCYIPEHYELKIINLINLRQM